MTLFPPYDKDGNLKALLDHTKEGPSCTTSFIINRKKCKVSAKVGKETPFKFSLRPQALIVQSRVTFKSMETIWQH